METVSVFFNLLCYQNGPLGYYTRELIKQTQWKKIWLNGDLLQGNLTHNSANVTQNGSDPDNHTHTKPFLEHVALHYQ
jgi:hypothetical protein